MRYYIGIDPGIEGAIALIKNGKVIQVKNIPFRKPVRGLDEISSGSRWFYKREVDCNMLQEILINDFNIEKIKIHEAYIEDITIINKTSKKSLLTIGKNYGSVVSVFDILSINLIPVSPTSWKKSLGVTSVKQTSIDYCKNIFGEEKCENLGLNVDHNRAESVLIAYFGYRGNRS